MTSAQRQLLEDAARCERQGFAGVAVLGSRVRAAHALEAAGLLHWEGVGEMEDDAVPGTARRIYSITDAGRAALAPGGSRG